MSGTLDWVKKNLMIVIFLLLMVIAIPAMVVISGKMNASVREKIDARANEKSKLESLKKTPVSFPVPGGLPESHTTLVNEQLLEEFTNYVTRQREDADHVIQLAIDHNRQGRSVLLPSLFPAPPLADREVLPREFHSLLQAAYEGLLREISAGDPPDAADVKADLQRQESQFRDKLLKTAGEKLTDEEADQLRAELTQMRLTAYVDRARELKIYASLESLSAPQWDTSRLPSGPELFEWQWDFWMTEDVLRAIAAANDGAESVLESAVKRLVSFRPQAYSSMHGEGAGGTPRGPGSAFAGGAFTGGVAGSETPGPTGTPANPAMEAPLDYSVSFTGRQTNPLYDVRYANLELIVDTEKIPLVMEALAAQNFITALSADLAPLDPHDHIGAGYYYESGKLTQLRLRLESVWLRDWTSPFMPDDVKVALGIPLPQPETVTPPVG